ncbi:hypothetical protein KR093_008453, partial [Drosophila rubida]
KRQKTLAASAGLEEDKASNEHNEHKEASKPKVLSGAAGQDNAAGIVSYY